MPVYRARWILPIADVPVRDGWISVEHGRIAACGSGTVEAAIDLGAVAVLPALVNAHTHLELSYLRGRVPASECFDHWVRSLMDLRRRHPDPADSQILRAAREAIREARRTGTGLLGDVGNTLVTVALLREEGMAAHVFHELTGFDLPNPDDRVRQARANVDAAGVEAGGVRVSLAPHAPYSVSPALFAAIRADLDAQPRGLSSVHLAESPEEVELLRHGTGAARAMLERLGVWTDAWPVPGVSPVAYLTRLGFLDSRVMVVHGVQLDGEDLSRLRALGVTLVSCPRSNRHVGVGTPPLEAFYAMGVRVAFGTDSLASAPDLDMFAELAEARRVAPRVPARTLLESATLAGARALGLGDELGSLEAGKRAALVAVRVPDDVGDVEEYLVSGIAPDAVAWIEGG
jgi:cytosine/adenosine deaminase-related metal-dependent hydrolase